MVRKERKNYEKRKEEKGGERKEVGTQSIWFVLHTVDAPLGTLHIKDGIIVMFLWFSLGPHIKLMNSLQNSGSDLQTAFFESMKIPCLGSNSNPSVGWIGFENDFM